MRVGSSVLEISAKSWPQIFGSGSTIFNPNSVSTRVFIGERSGTKERGCSLLTPYGVGVAVLQSFDSISREMCQHLLNTLIGGFLGVSWRCKPFAQSLPSFL